MTDTEKVLRATIRELERLNTELNDELGTAVQVLKLERDGLCARLVEGLDAVRAMDERLIDEGLLAPYTESLDASLIRAALATEPTSNEPQSSPKFDAPGPDPDGGLDLTDEEFAAFLKAARG